MAMENELYIVMYVMVLLYSRVQYLHHRHCMHGAVFEIIVLNFLLQKWTARNTNSNREVNIP